MSKLCVITGVGEGNGVAMSRRFAAEGYRVAMLARTKSKLDEFEKAIEGTRGYACDVTDPAAVTDAIERIREDLGPTDVFIHNAGSGMFKQFSDTTIEDMETSWRINTLALLQFGQAAAEDMLKTGSGSIVVTGATSSLRGGANFAPFASSKAAQRSLAQSMARSLGPQNIHVSYIIVDGVIDLPRTRELFAKDEPDEFFIKAEDIAEAAYYLAHQPRSAWTFELDLRPFGEKW